MQLQMRYASHAAESWTRSTARVASTYSPPLALRTTLRVSQTRKVARIADAAPLGGRQHRVAGQAARRHNKGARAVGAADPWREWGQIHAGRPAHILQQSRACASLMSTTSPPSGFRSRACTASIIIMALS